MKAYALGRRITFRDYIDLYFLLKRKIVTLDDIIQDATTKFTIAGENVFSTKLFLQQLIYTDDVEDKDAAIDLIVDEKLAAEEVEAFLREQVRCFLDDETALKGDLRP